MALIFLDRQHSGNPSRRSSLGAVDDLNNDGKKEIHEAEAIWTARYLLACEIRLRELGHDVIPISDGRYFERHDRANIYQKGGELGIYIAAHLNAGLSRGGIGYGAMFYDYRSTKGKDLAEQICNQLKIKCPELQNKAKAIRASSEDWTKNAFYTIRGVRAIGICAEPCFIDSAAHKPLFSQKGMRLIGEAIAEGIQNFTDSQ
jgi:N-acetylmuramoyl-L-alanine amidase